jgi:hypothetical protein
MASPPPASTKKGLVDIRNGAMLQMAEAATLGLPLEVWKTRMGRFRSEGTLTAFRNVYTVGGGGLNGVRAFWAGFTPKVRRRAPSGANLGLSDPMRPLTVPPLWPCLSPKMVESATKGAVLMVAKEGFKDAAAAAGVDPFLGAVMAGAFGGTVQTVVLAPCVCRHRCTLAALSAPAAFR